MSQRRTLAVEGLETRLALATTNAGVAEVARRVTVDLSTIDAGGKAGILLPALSKDVGGKAGILFPVFRPSGYTNPCFIQG